MGEAKRDSAGSPILLFGVVYKKDMRLTGTEAAAGKKRPGTAGPSLSSTVWPLCP